MRHPEGPRVLAIDPGERRLGIAISDPMGRIALPLEVRGRKGWSGDLAYVRKLVETYGVAEVVVGRPLTASGTVGSQAESAARFALRLRAALRIPVVEVDERFSTAGADRAMREGGAGGRERRRKRDAVAAALILQPYLDRRRRPLPGSDEGVMLPP
ncbi:MAG: Holliday junction resolvase RuvX [Armatimonadetes bacterium]|nr:Holliday junction resolvase RuvX [Armatimonadota bacterium]